MSRDKVGLCQPVLYYTIVTLSAKRYRIAEQTVSSLISCFHTFVIVFMVNTTQGETKIIPVDSHE